MFDSREVSVMTEKAASINKTVMTDGSVRIEGGGHVAVVTRLRPGSLLIVEEGTQNPETRALMMREVDRELASGAPISVFVDLRGSNRLDAEGRDAWSEYGKRRKSSIRRVVLLVRSKLLEMAFSLVGLFVGGGLIRVVSREADLVDAIREEVPSFRGLPSLAQTASPPAH
jgi:hypothetical protein